MVEKYQISLENCTRKRKDKKGRKKENICTLTEAYIRRVMRTHFNIGFYFQDQTSTYNCAQY